MNDPLPEQNKKTKFLDPVRNAQAVGWLSLVAAAFSFWQSVGSQTNESLVEVLVLAALGVALIRKKRWPIYGLVALGAIIAFFLLYLLFTTPSDFLPALVLGGWIIPLAYYFYRSRSQFERGILR